MQFLNPLFLIGSLALIAPILIHLVRRESSRRVLFSSLMFVRRTPKASLRKQRLQHPLLLLLRLAALLLLVLAIARPLLTDPDAVGLSGSGGRSLVLLLDDSFSMRFGDRFERAQAQARAILEGLAPGDRVQTVVYSDSTRLLNRPEANPREVGKLIDALEPGFSGTDHGPALRLADQVLAGTPEGSPEIHWISDFQESGWQPGSAHLSINERVELRTYPAAQTPGPNLSIGRLTIEPENRSCFPGRRHRRNSIPAPSPGAGPGPGPGDQRAAGPQPNGPPESWGKRYPAGPVRIASRSPRRVHRQTSPPVRGCPARGQLRLQLPLPSPSAEDPAPGYPPPGPLLPEPGIDGQSRFLPGRDSGRTGAGSAGRVVFLRRRDSEQLPLSAGGRRRQP